MNIFNRTMASKKVIVFFMSLSILTTAFFTGCKSKKSADRIVIWTNCSEVAQYIELFNKTHNSVQAVLVYKDNPAASLPPAKDELPPDIVIGSWLRTDSTIKKFKSLEYLFDHKNLTSSMFYELLLNSGKTNYSQKLLPVSFNLPAIIFSNDNSNLVTDPYTLSLEQIRPLATEFNSKNKKGSISRIGFAPSADSNFLYFASKVYGANFHEGKGKILWNEENLNKTVSNLKDWITTANGSAQEEQDFAFKYLFMPDYRQVTSGRTLFAYTTSNELFTNMKTQELNIDYRWIANNNSIEIEDNFTMLGIYKKARNQPGATEFITWFYNSENQEAMLSRKADLNLNTEMFGIAGGFSAVRDVTEHILPLYYTPLLSNLPPAQLLNAPQKLPARWESYKNIVVEPYIKGAVSAVEGTEITPITELEKEWRKKVFDN